MSVNVLSTVDTAMKAAGLNYDFMEWNDTPKYPYWVGEYQEFENQYENGLIESSFLLTGFSRGSWIQLELDKEKIQKAFPIAGGRIVTMEDNSVVTIFYAGSSVIPTGDGELKRMEVNLKVKEWRAI